ncbi:uncharacterized protein LOC144153071 [Haemaphysalis longicornis]
MQAMGEPYPSAWAHYYQATGGTYMPWPHFPQSQGYFHPGLQQEHYYMTPQQPGYGFYQAQWNQACQGFPQSDSCQPAQQADATPTLEKDVCRDEAGSANTDSYETLPMDISPSGSPVKREVRAKRQEASAMIPVAPSAFTEAPTDIRRLLLKPRASESPPAKHAMKTLKVMKFECSDTLNAQSSVFSLLEKCVSCTKKILAVAKGQGSAAVAEPCTCGRKSASSEILQSKPHSLGMTKKALERSLGRPLAVAKCANVEHPSQSDGRTTRDFKRRCRTRWDIAPMSNLGHGQVSNHLQPTSSDAEPEKPKPISISSRLPQASYFGAQGPANSELPRSSWKGTVSESAEIVMDSVPAVPHHQMAPESSCPVKTVMPAASHKSNETTGTADACNGDKVKGTYSPDSTIDTSQTTCINIKVDVNLGGFVEMMNGPVELPSELEKLDEGWVLSFE